MQARKKILLLSTSFPRWKNDYYSPFLLDYANALSKCGIEVTVVTTHMPGSEIMTNIGNITIFRLRYFFEKYELLNESKAGIPAAWEKNKLTFFLIIFFIIRLAIYLIFNTNKYDFINSHWTITSFAAVITKRFHKKKIITSLHGSDIFLATKLPFIKNITKFILDNSDKIFCVSQAIKDQILLLGYKKNNIKVLPNGIDLKQFTKTTPSKKNQLLFVGSLTKNKSVDTLINSFQLIHNEFSDFTLQIIGNGPEENNLKRMCGELNLENKIYFLGSLNKDQVIDFMKSSYLLILPSIKEGFGVVILEAMAVGLPCIASRTGGILDIVNESRGCLFDVGDSHQLYSCIKDLIVDKSKYEIISENCKLFVRNNYDWEKLILKYINEFN